MKIAHYISCKCSTWPTYYILVYIPQGGYKEEDSVFTVLHSIPNAWGTIVRIQLMFVFHLYIFIHTNIGDKQTPTEQRALCSAQSQDSGIMTGAKGRCLID